MNLSDIKKVAVPRRKKWRRGKGESSGSGKTSGRGGKGQTARSGVSFRPYFEGGQMPLIRRIPKRGFNNNAFKKVFALVNLNQLNAFKNDDTVDPEKLLSIGAIESENDGIKILGSGELKKKLTVKAHKFSKKAVDAIKKAGGTVQIVN